MHTYIINTHMHTYIINTLKHTHAYLIIQTNANKSQYKSNQLQNMASLPSHHQIELGVGVPRSVRVEMGVGGCRGVGRVLVVGVEASAGGRWAQIG